MLPITRVDLQNFCRACLCELSSTKEPNRFITGVSFNNNFPNYICNSCHLKVIALKEFQRKTIFSTGILRLIVDDEKSKVTSKSALRRLYKYCRVCLKRQSNERYNIRNSQELCSGISECSGVLFIGSNGLDFTSAKDAIQDDLRFPGALCNRCYATLNSFMQFQTVSKQTAEYLKNVLMESENLDVVQKIEEAFQKDEHLDLEALELTELLPRAVSCHFQLAFSNSDNEALGLETLNEGSHKAPATYLQSSESIINSNDTSSNHSDTEAISKKLTSKIEKQPIPGIVSKPISIKKSIITKQRVSQIPSQNLRCQECNKFFRKQFLYEAHIKSVHKGIKNAFPCHHCDQSYANMKALQRHVNSYHNKNNHNANYICKYCERAFKRNVRLNEHITTVHQKLKPFTCGICYKSFGTKNILVRHEKNHSSEKPFSCEYCGKRYNSKSDLNVHIQRHTANPELLCPICKRAQPNKEELEKHIERHSKAYQCTTCGKIFQKMVNLREHVDTVHLKQKFYCQFCSVAFSARKSLKNHELSHNATNWPEICVECNLYFKSKHSLLIHMKKSHAKLLNSNNKTEHQEKCTRCACRFETNESLQEHMEKLHTLDLKNEKSM